MDKATKHEMKENMSLELKKKIKKKNCIFP